ncbi:MAG: STELLO glycosyltransferase family protein [Sedimenticola sp.]
MNNKWIVITTIQDKKTAMDLFDEQDGWTLVVVGDRKGPSMAPIKKGVFLHINDQDGLGFEYSGKCPENHYARKNIGYLYAMQNKAELIAESDDDNIPIEGWGTNIDFSGRYIKKINGSGFYNIYNEFTTSHVWPRGYPLNKIKHHTSFEVDKHCLSSVAVWQGLADKDPDVDAIYRLTVGEDVDFVDGEIVLGEGVYCPFNSQNTFWKKSAFLFMYLPSTVSFRYTDILRGYVCQRMLWKNDENLGFTSPSVVQERNVHDLHDDFVGEISMYTSVNAVVEYLANLDLSGLSDSEAMIKAYDGLFNMGVVEEKELLLLDLWLTDAEKLYEKHN